MEYIINSRFSFDKFRKDPNIKNAIRRVKLDLPFIKDQKGIEKSLNKGVMACGCQEGAMAVFIALFINVFLLITGKFSIKGDWMLMLGIMLLAALAGKLFGLLLSKQKFKAALKLLDQLLLAEGMS